MKSDRNLPARIAIIGGGTSGGIAAAMLSRLLCPIGIRIQLVKPKGDSGIGVGEATIPSIHRLLSNLGIDETDFLRRTSGSYKLGIRFVDWHQLGHEYWHPFGYCGVPINGQDLFHHWLYLKQERGLQLPYHTYSLQWRASIAGKSPVGFGDQSPLAATKSYAFHVDAKLFVELLEEQARLSGTEFIDATVTGIRRDPEKGTIQELMLDNGSSCSADLYLDCTGFTNALFDQSPQHSQFTSWHPHLLCDRAIAARVPGKRAIPPYTTAQAAKNGWIWNVPLVDRLGVGYVYSSAHTTDEQAHLELIDCLRGQVTDSEFDLNRVEIMPIKFRVGRHTMPWSNNVVAIGMAAGFIEPLESTAIHVAQVGTEMLIELLPNMSEISWFRETYNRRMSKLFDEIRDFVQLHYLLSKRSDTPFWAAARATEVTHELSKRINDYHHLGWCEAITQEAFAATSYYFLLTGNQQFPLAYPGDCIPPDPIYLEAIFNQIMEQNQQGLRELPLHEEMLDWIHEPPAFDFTKPSTAGPLAWP